MGPTVGSILAEHAGLVVSCVDRIYLNGYVPKLQTSGQLVYFLGEHLGNPLVSPALLGQLGERYRREIERFVARHRIRVVRFERGQRKDDVAKELRRAQGDVEGVVFLGIAQERCKSFKASKRGGGDGGPISFDFSRQSVFVNQLYFYVHDSEWGPAFVKVGTYVPYPVKLCLNGHEWVKQQLRREGIAFESLDNGFLSCARPERLSELCEALGPNQITAFYQRWLERLPWPLTAKDRQAGFSHQLSIWQIELSLTHVFDRPLNGRHFFEQVIRENLDLGRPSRVRLLFGRPLSTRTPPPTYGYRTRVITAGVDPSLHVEYKSCHVKQYFKEGRALRTETTINEPADFGLPKKLASMSQLKAIGNAVNQRLLTTERVAEDCVVALEGLADLQTASTIDGLTTPALRFGDRRVMALMNALCLFALHLDTFRNQDLRQLVARLVGSSYAANQMTYDLRRLRRRGLIARVPHTHAYVVTPAGLRVAFLYSRLSQRLLQPAWAALLPVPTAAAPVQRAVRTLYHHFEQLLDRAGFKAAA
jgi:hypothetical protein